MKMCERWDSSDENSETVDFEANMLDEMLRLTIDVLGRTAFSYDFQVAPSVLPPTTPHGLLLLPWARVHECTQARVKSQLRGAANQ